MDNQPYQKVGQMDIARGISESAVIRDGDLASRLEIAAAFRLTIKPEDRRVGYALEHDNQGDEALSQLTVDITREFSAVLLWHHVLQYHPSLLCLGGGRPPAPMATGGGSVVLSAARAVSWAACATCTVPCKCKCGGRGLGGYHDAVQSLTRR